MMMEEFERDFVIRTKYTIEKEAKYNTYEITVLLNSLLGLLSFPIENRTKNTKFRKACLNYLTKNLKVTFKSHNDFTPNESKKFRAIRNAIAHGHIELFGESKIEKIKLWNTISSTNHKMGISYEFTTNTLKKFALFVADKYLLYKYYNYPRNFDPTDVEGVEKKILTYYSHLNSHNKKLVLDYAKEIYESEKGLFNHADGNTENSVDNDSESEIIKITLYNLPASAGTGEPLSNEDHKIICIPKHSLNQTPDFALKVSGDSMEPKYNDGDIILVKQQFTINVGQIGIFIKDGEGYVKKFGEDCLISLNPEYAPIPLNEDTKCVGIVIGKTEPVNPS